MITFWAIQNKQDPKLYWSFIVWKWIEADEGPSPFSTKTDAEKMITRNKINGRVVEYPGGF